MTPEKTLSKPDFQDCDATDTATLVPLADYLARLRTILPAEDFAKIRQPSEGCGW